MKIQNYFPEVSILKDLHEEKRQVLKEECGVFAVYSSKTIDTFGMIQFGLFSLQHRGQEAAGFSVLKDGFIKSFKREGLVLDVFKLIEDIVPFDEGNAVIGHTRYSTAGGSSTKNIQPLFSKDKNDNSYLSVAHNGNLINAVALRTELESDGLVFLSDHSDTEVILKLIEKYLDLGIEEAVRKTCLRIKGAYSVVVLTKNELVVFRDINGIRPLCLGVLDENTFVACSESCALDTVGAQYIRDVLPGEMVIFDKKGHRSAMITNETQKRMCSFEYIYFSRPDSHLEQIDVYDIREKSGEKLFEQFPVDADMVIGVPDSGVPAAVGFARASGIPFKPILIKNKYIGRSFIVPSQEMREKLVNLKLNPIISKIKDKRIVIIDDSLVRGTTSKRLVEIFKKAGAKEIHFRSASPPIIAPCFLGIDTPQKTDLASANNTTEEIREMMGVDSLAFLELDNFKELLGSEDYCFGCFTEKYPVNKN